VRNKKSFLSNYGHDHKTVVAHPIYQYADLDSALYLCMLLAETGTRAVLCKVHDGRWRVPTGGSTVRSN